jgi:primase-polymerase (primpol)-like protein
VLAEWLPIEPTAEAVVAATVALRSDEEVLARALASKNGMKLRRLFAGDASAHDGDDSRADLALLSALAFWTQDREQLDRIFRRSKLADRVRWTERADYRERTLDKAPQGSKRYDRTNTSKPTRKEHEFTGAHRQRHPERRARRG